MGYWRISPGTMKPQVSHLENLEIWYTSGDCESFELCSTVDWISFMGVSDDKRLYRSTVLSSFVRTRLRQYKSLELFLSCACERASAVTGTVAFPGH